MTPLCSPALLAAARLTGVSVPDDATTGEAGLHDVSLRITSGTLTVVLGGRVDGTRTLLRTLGGQTPARAGTAEVASRIVSSAGLMVLDDPAQSRRRVGLVLHDAPLFPYLTVAENVALPARFAEGRSRSTGSQVTTLCRSVGLGQDLHRLPHDLCPVERQQVALAQVLAYAPDLVLVEGSPGDGSDVLRLAQVVSDLVHLEGRTIVMTLTTDLLTGTADQVVRLSGGRVVGSPR
jgi:ABC-type ATPase involved in cell division